MRRYVVRDPRAGNIALQDLPESLTAHFMSLAVCKKRGFRSVPDEMITSILYIFREQVSAGIPDGNDPFFLVSAADHISQLQIDVFQFHMDKFADTHSCRIQKFKHRLVAYALGCSHIRKFQNPVYLLDRQHPGHLLFHFRRFQILRRILLQNPLLQKILEKSPDRCRIPGYCGRGIVLILQFLQINLKIRFPHSLRAGNPSVFQIFIQLLQVPLIGDFRIIGCIFSVMQILCKTLNVLFHFPTLSVFCHNLLT